MRWTLAKRHPVLRILSPQNRATARLLGQCLARRRAARLAERAALRKLRIRCAHQAIEVRLLRKEIAKLAERLTDMQLVIDSLERIGM